MEAQAGTGHGGGRAALAALAAPWALLALGAILLVAIALRAWDLGLVDERAGEELTEERARAPWDDAIRSMAEPRNQGPLYFLMLRALPGSSIADLRAPSVVLGVLAVAMLVALVMLLFRDRALALWSGALLAVSPLHVLLSRLARPYGLLVVLSMAVMWLFVGVVRGRGRAWWVGLTCVSALAYLTHFTALVLPVAEGIVLLAMRTRDRGVIARWIGSQAIAVLPLLAWVGYAVTTPRDPSEGSIPGPTLATIPRAVWNVLVGAGIDTGWWMAPAIALACIGLLAGGIWSASREDVARATMLAVALAASVPTFVAVLTVTTKYSDRYLAVALPAFLILVAAGWLRTRLRAAGAIALAVIVVSSGIVAVGTTFGGREPGEDWSGAADVLVAEAGPDDLVIFQRWTTRAALEDALPDRATPDWTSIELDEQPTTGQAERDAKRIWVVYRDPIENFHTGAYDDFEPLEPGLSEMSDWLVARRGRIVEERMLEGMRILELEPPRG